MNCDFREVEEYIEAGWAEQLFVLHKKGKRPRDFGWRSRKYGAVKMSAAAVQGFNVGVRLEPGDLILDVDPRNFLEGDDPFARLIRDTGLDPDRIPTVLTGGEDAGRHLYLSKPPEVPTTGGLKDYKGLDFKTVGGYVVAAGSLHPTGGRYCWDPESPTLSDVGAQEVSDALLALLRHPLPRTGGAEGAGVSLEELEELLTFLPAQEYSDHDEWLRIMMACHHASGGIGREVFVDWSATDERYMDHGGDVGARWDSLSREPPGRIPVTAATLYREVLLWGGSLPQGRPEEDFKEELEADENGEEPPAGPTLLEEMNATYSAVLNGGHFRIAYLDEDPGMGRSYWRFARRQDFENFYCNRFVERGDKVVPVGKWWLESPRRRQYLGVIFDPQREHQDLLNLWTGWAVEPARGDWSHLRELIFGVLCDWDWECHEYVLDWIAYYLQTPWKPAEVAIVFKGDKGCGKGTLGRALCALAGRHGLPITNRKHLTGRFNKHLRDCVFLFVDEAHWAGNMEGESVLKAIITEQTLAYEPKGIDVMQGRNHVHVMMASNKEWVVPAGLDRERRFAVFQANDSAIEDYDRFDAIAAQLETGGLAGMLHELLRRDLRGWHPRQGVPRTGALLEQKLRTMDDVDSWWLDMLTVGMLPGGERTWDDEAQVVFVQELVEDLERDLPAHVVRAKGRRSIGTALGLRLRTLVPLMQRKRIAVEEKAIKADAAGRAVAYVMPPLSECRRAFEKRIGGRMEW